MSKRVFINLAAAYAVLGLVFVGLRIIAGELPEWTGFWILPYIALLVWSFVRYRRLIAGLVGDAFTVLGGFLFVLARTDYTSGWGIGGVILWVVVVAIIGLSSWYVLRNVSNREGGLERVTLDTPVRSAF